MSVAWLRSPVGLGRATAILLGLVVAVQLFAAGTDALLYDVYDDIVAGKGVERVRVVDAMYNIGVAAQIVSLVPTAVVYLCWFWRVRVNAEVFAPAGHSKKRGWAIGGWFVPFANLWFPRQVMGDIWKASVPGGRTVSQGLANAWWAVWVLWLVLDRWVSVSSRSVETFTELRQVTGSTLVADLVGAVAGVLAILVVVRVTRMQDEKARVGAWGGAVPVG
ncbi:DUF4328 domain-containing protein [Streptomyces sp. S6]